MMKERFYKTSLMSLHLSSKN